MIDKITAHTLAAHGFRLVDKEGDIYEILTVGNVDIMIRDVKYPEGVMSIVTYDQIGTDFWVLKRDFSMLTKSIMVDGKEIVPIVEIGKNFQRNINWQLTEKGIFHKGVEIKGESIDLYFEWDTYEKGFIAYYKRNTGGDKMVRNVNSQEKLFKKAYSLHFINLPEGTYKLIEG